MCLLLRFSTELLVAGLGYHLTEAIFSLLFWFCNCKRLPSGCKAALRLSGKAAKPHPGIKVTLLL
jgi:hypothetical protein